MTQPTGLEPFAFLATNESHDSFSFTFDRVGSVLDAQQIYKICEKLGNISDVNIDVSSFAFKPAISNNYLTVDDHKPSRKGARCCTFTI